MGKLPKILVSLLLCCTLLCGCSLLPGELDPIELKVVDLSMTLPGYFENMVNENTGIEVEGFFMYGYSEILITGLRDAYEVFDQVPTLEGYANQLIEDNKLSSQIEIVDGLTTFTYRKLENSESYTYMTAVFAGSEAFWMITVGCKTMNFDSAKAKLVEILKTTQVA